LLAHGAEVNDHQSQGAVTPLHSAAMAGYPEMIQLLVEHGANLEARDTEFNSTPFEWAKFFKQEAAIITPENAP
jgi:ankyrin repeat protein